MHYGYSNIISRSRMNIACIVCLFIHYQLTIVIYSNISKFNSQFLENYFQRNSEKIIRLFVTIDEIDKINSNYTFFTYSDYTYNKLIN